ncbi:MAG: hypothetical protein AAFR75_02425 [Pseudomonadota bacterium]
MAIAIETSWALVVSVFSQLDAEFYDLPFVAPSNVYKSLQRGDDRETPSDECGVINS